MSNRKKKYQLNRRKGQRGGRQPLSISVMIGGIAIFAIGLLIVVGGNDSAQAEISYQPEDIVTDSPFVAVHEMSPSTISQIDFSPKGSPQPKIAVSEAFFDFGSIGATEVVQHDFIIANQGESPLTINRAYTTCGCTTGEFSASVIPPGKVAVVTLVLDAGFHDVRGQTVRRGIIIENNDPDNSQIEIWTQAKVRTTP